MIDKTNIIILIIGAVFACTAPFIHIFYPVKHANFEVYENQLQNNIISQADYDLKIEKLEKEESFVGFSNIRKFWYAIGKPITMLYFSLLLIYIEPFIMLDKHIKLLVRIAAALFVFISIYFITWTLWYRQDFPKTLYYLMIGLVSLMGSSLSILISNYNRKRQKNLHSLMNFIVIDVKKKYISAEDKKKFVEDYINEIEKLQ